MTGKYFGLFTCLDDVKKAFAVTGDFLCDEDILYASYVNGDYEKGYIGGDADVLFRKDGELFHVEGTYCSCCKHLEGQWRPVKTTPKFLLNQHIKWEKVVKPKWYNDYSVEDAFYAELIRKLNTEGNTILEKRNND